MEGAADVVREDSESGAKSSAQCIGHRAQHTLLVCTKYRTLVLKWQILYALLSDIRRNISQIRPHLLLYCNCQGSYLNSITISFRGAVSVGEHQLQCGVMPNQLVVVYYTGPCDGIRIWQQSNIFSLFLEQQNCHYQIQF
jgi:hypothetical protein